MRAALTAILLAVALFPASAQAKEGIERLTVCGSSGCRTVDDPQLLTPLIAGLLGTEPQPAPPAGSFFTLVPEATAGWAHTWPRFVYVPEAQLVRQADGRGGADWYPLIWTAGAYERATDGLTPFPEPLSWSKLKSAAPQDEGAERVPVAIGAAAALAVVGGAGFGLLRRRRSLLHD